MSRRDVTLYGEDAQTFDAVHEHLSQNRVGDLSNPEVVRRLMEHYVATEKVPL
ncbi:hypothetical protein ACFQJC_14505 [Haloferax namakaokahaiae]|uniref:Uncharacterized protein n=1 Tax=Haloferax namakaokahaiae TaxID=1748331 RepID=A0ABD5ZIK8_9EURY